MHILCTYLHTLYTNQKNHTTLHLWNIYILYILRTATLMYTVKTYSWKQFDNSLLHNLKRQILLMSSCFPYFVFCLFGAIGCPNLIIYHCSAGVKKKKKIYNSLSKPSKQVFLYTLKLSFCLLFSSFIFLLTDE